MSASDPKRTSVDYRFGRNPAPVEGGVPLLVDNQVIGAIGASGGLPSDDGAVANAGAKDLRPKREIFQQAVRRQPGEFQFAARMNSRKARSLPGIRVRDG